MSTRYLRGIWVALIGAFVASACSKAAPAGVQLPACDEGDILQYVAGQWTCGPATHLLPTCGTGQTAFWDGIQWSCSSFVQPPSSCTDGNVLQLVQGAWQCQPSPLPSSLMCNQGATLTWDGMAWNCGPNVTGALSSPDALAAQLGIAPVAQTSMHATEGSITPKIGLTMSATKSQMVPNDCLDIDHNWGTNAIGYAAWRLDSTQSPAVWVALGESGVTQPDNNTMRLCNNTGSTSDFALVIWR